MDNHRFDGISRALATGANRRAVVKALLGIGGAAALAPFAQPDEADAARRSTPTPAVPKCPGSQVWSNGQCRCPSGVTCGSDCCATAAQCCDNACCPAGSMCTSEEVCCPQAQICGDACCAPGQDCCSAGDPVCIDRSADSCCVVGDCPTSTDACFTYDCQDHLCVEVAAITCPSGQECLDGECVCAGGAEPCGTGDTAVCCPAGEYCGDDAFGESLGLCCTDGIDACYGITGDPVCCSAAGFSCQPYDVPNAGPFDFCCDGVPCYDQGVKCCAVGEVCGPTGGCFAPA